MADGERSQVGFVYASSAILCYAEARTRAASIQPSSSGWAQRPRRSPPHCASDRLRWSGRSVERARSIATARPSRRSPSRVLWLSRTESRAMACPSRAHCQPGLAHADVDAEQDGRGSDGPSALAAEVSLARRGRRAMALGACSSEGRRVEDGHTPSVRAMCSG